MSIRPPVTVRVTFQPLPPSLWNRRSPDPLVFPTPFYTRNRFFPPEVSRPSFFEKVKWCRQEPSTLKGCDRTHPLPKDVRPCEIQNRHFCASSEDRHAHERTVLHVLFALRFWEKKSISCCEASWEWFSDISRIPFWQTSFLWDKFMMLCKPIMLYWPSLVRLNLRWPAWRELLLF